MIELTLAHNHAVERLCRDYADMEAVGRIVKDTRNNGGISNYAHTAVERAIKAEQDKVIDYVVQELFCTKRPEFDAIWLQCMSLTKSLYQPSQAELKRGLAQALVDGQHAFVAQTPYPRPEATTDKVAIDIEAHRSTSSVVRFVVSARSLV